MLEPSFYLRPWVGSKLGSSMRWNDTLGAFVAAGLALLTVPAVAQTVPTPNAERDVTLAALNKRTGETKVFAGHPGQAFEFGTLRVTVRACETTPPWERKLTGAFLLIDDAQGKGPPKRVFSGWMFAESPSLHPLESALYDVWVKSCTMRFPETGPDTVVAGPSVSSAPKRSIAKKSPPATSADASKPL